MIHTHTCTCTFTQINTYTRDSISSWSCEIANSHTLMALITATTIHSNNLHDHPWPPTKTKTPSLYYFYGKIPNIKKTRATICCYNNFLIS